MERSSTYLAVDLGGGSGRIIAGRLPSDGSSSETFVLEEIYRFANYQINRNGHMCWDFDYLKAEILKGLSIAAEGCENIVSIGVDTWGVDYVLIDKAGEIIGDMICYRDERTNGIPDEIAKIIPRDELYSIAGIQDIFFNTIYQLYAHKQESPEAFEVAERLLFTPDLFNYILTGRMANEYTIASTSGLLDARSGEWSRYLLDKLSLPNNIFGDIVKPLTVLGCITPEIARLTGLPQSVKVICVGSHDTASAIAATPALDEQDSLFISSGTWSLLGACVESPILTEAAAKAGFTNEGGVCDKICYLRNITGLWIVQSLMKEWGERDYSRMIAQAQEIDCDCVINVDDPMFIAPESMQEAIISYSQREGVDLPDSRAGMINMICRSIAVKYQEGVESIQSTLQRKFKRIYIFGGGSKNMLLNQLTADATQLELCICSDEATALGNIMTQALTLRDITYDEIKIVTPE